MKIGDLVEKIGGDYTFKGVIAGEVIKCSGETRYVVEDDRGALHIYRGAQLKLAGLEFCASAHTKQLKAFNTMYKLPVHETPQLPTVERLRALRSMLLEEMDELTPIIDTLLGARGVVRAECALAELADFLCDMQIYCGTFMIECGIPVDESLAIVMQSNFS